MTEAQLTIGELARRTGVTTSALRYWEELGLLPPPARVSGQRRYLPSTVDVVCDILLLQDIGYRLRDIKALIAPRPSAAGWRELHQRQLAEIDRRIAEAHAARTAIAHALACPQQDIRACPNYRSVAAARRAGSPLIEAHRH